MLAGETLGGQIIRKLPLVFLTNAVREFMGQGGRIGAIGLKATVDFLNLGGLRPGGEVAH